MKYNIHYSGYYGFNIEVEADSKEEAEQKADIIFDDVKVEDYCFDPEPTVIWRMEMTVEEKVDEAIKEWMNDCNIDYNEAMKSIIESYGGYALRGYGIFTSSDTDVLHIEKIDDLCIYDSDLEAAKQAEKDGFKLIHDIEIPKNNALYFYKNTFIDTPENRERLRKELEKCN